MNNEEDEKPAIIPAYAMICMQCFQESRGVNKKMSEFAALIEELRIIECPSTRVKLTISSGS